MSGRIPSRVRRGGALAAVAALVGGVLLTAAGAAPAAAAARAAGSATVTLAGPLAPPAPDANEVGAITIPLTITNTGTGTLYDVGISSLRSAPITTGAQLDTAFDGDPVQESDSTKPGPVEALARPLAAGASVGFDYRVDTSNERSGICLCFLGVYALDVLVNAADEPDGESATVARVQTYLPSLLKVQAEVGVGWLWPLLDRPHRLAAGAVFTDDDLAASVRPGGRLDRALQVVERLDATKGVTAAVSRSLVLLLDPDLLDELVTMTTGYKVQPPDGPAATGTGGLAAAAWLARLAAVLPRHDVRTTPPADPDVVGLAARGVPVQTTPDVLTTARTLLALRLPAATVLRHDLGWPVGPDLDAAGLAALRASGATGVVTAADTDHDGSVAAVAGSGAPTPALLADPALTDLAASAIGIGQDHDAALQRLVADTAMTSVLHEADSRFVFVVPGRDLDVDPAAAVRAVLATTSLGTPVSALSALGEAATATARSDLLTTDPGPAPAPLGAALDAAAAATTAAATIREAVVSGADAVVGDLASAVQRAVSNSWVGQDAPAARAVSALDARATELGGAVQVVVKTGGNYSLASADAPLLLTVANHLNHAVRIRVDVAAVGRANGFSAGQAETVTVAAGGRPTLRIPTKVTRSGRFQVAVTLRTTTGSPIGPPATIAVSSTAVGAVGLVVTYGAGALLALALVLRGVRRLIARSRAGSDRPGTDDDMPTPDGRAEDLPTVPAKRS